MERCKVCARICTVADKSQFLEPVKTSRQPVLVTGLQHMQWCSHRMGGKYDLGCGPRYCLLPCSCLLCFSDLPLNSVSFPITFLL